MISPLSQESSSPQKKSAAERFQEANIQIGPNPTHDILNISLTLPKDTAGQMAIYAMDGILMESGNLEERMSIDMTSYPKSIYLLVISIGEYVETWKIIKE